MAGKQVKTVVITIVMGLAIFGGVLGINAVRGGSSSGAVSVGNYANKGAEPSPRVGSFAPDFELSLVGGGNFRLSENKGSYVWLNFWATWCPPCRVEMPEIEAVYPEAQAMNVRIVAVDMAESEEVVVEYAEKTGITFPLALDSNYEATALYQIRGLPTHVFIDAEGVIREIRVGPMSRDTMLEKLKRLTGAYLQR